MFDERRSRITAGIDKSFLLEPIETKTSITNKHQQQQRQVIGKVNNARDQKMINYSKVIVPPLQNRLINHQPHDINGNNHFNDEPIERTTTLRTNDNLKTTKVLAKVNLNNNNNVSGTTRKLTPKNTTPTTTSSVPLKNVTNQKVRLFLFHLSKRYSFMHDKFVCDKNFMFK